MSKPFTILFAGAIGSSKSPIANFLSHKLNLPILNNDTIRTEVREDFLEFNQEEYLKRRIKRLKDIIKRKLSFIYDASIDRKWKDFKELIEQQEYAFHIISLNLSESFIEKLYHAKGYKDIDAMQRTVREHNKFISN